MESKEQADKVLDKMFAEFRVEPIAFEAEEALVMARAKQVKGISSLWYKIMIGLICLVSLYVLLWKKPTTENIQPQLVKPKKHYEGDILVSKPAAVENKVMFTLPKGNPKVKLSQALLGQPEKSQAIETGFGKPTWSLPTAEPEPFKPLVLGAQELHKLHIYTDYCELYYTNLKDSIFIHRNMLSKAPISCFFYMHIDKPGGGYTNTCQTRFIKKQLDSLNQFLLHVYPMMITQKVEYSEGKNSAYVKVGDIKRFILDYQNQIVEDSLYAAGISDLLVPVEIHLIGKANIYGKRDQTITFWYKPNEAFLNALTQENKQEVELHYPKFSEESFQSKLQYITNNLEKTSRHTLIESVVFDSLLLHAQNLSKKQLKSLGIKFTASKIAYKHTSAFNKIKLIIKPEQILIYSNRTSADVTKNEGIAGRAMFYSETHLSTLTLLDFSWIPEGLTPNQKKVKIEELFKNQYPNLIPVEVPIKDKTGKEKKVYFWFSKSLIP